MYPRSNPLIDAPHLPTAQVQQQAPARWSAFLDDGQKHNNQHRKAPVWQQAPATNQSSCGSSKQSAWQQTTPQRPQRQQQQGNQPHEQPHQQGLGSTSDSAHPPQQQGRLYSQHKHYSAESPWQPNSHVQTQPAVLTPSPVESAATVSRVGPRHSSGPCQQQQQQQQHSHVTPGWQPQGRAQGIQVQPQHWQQQQQPSSGRQVFAGTSSCKQGPAVNSSSASAAAAANEQCQGTGWLLDDEDVLLPEDIDELFAAADCAATPAGGQRGSDASAAAAAAAAAGSGAIAGVRNTAVVQQQQQQQPSRHLGSGNARNAPLHPAANAGTPCGAGRQRSITAAGSNQWQPGQQQDLQQQVQWQELPNQQYQQHQQQHQHGHAHQRQQSRHDQSWQQQPPQWSSHQQQHYTHQQTTHQQLQAVPAGQPTQLLARNQVDPAAASRWSNSRATQPLRVARPGSAGAGGSDAAASCKAGKGAASSGSKAAGKAGKAGSSKRGKIGTPQQQQSANIEWDFVRKTPGITPPAQPMKQATLEDTLRRAQQNRQQEQQQQQQDEQGAEGEQQQQQQQNGSGGCDAPDDDDFERFFPASNSGRKQPSAGSGEAAEKPSSRKRKSASAAPAEAEASSSGNGSRKRKKSSKSAAAEQALQEATDEATEHLDLAALQRNSSSVGGLLLDLNSKAAWQQLQQDLAVAEAVALGLLLCKRAGQAVQYYSSLQPLSKQQQQLLKKQARACRKVAAATAAAADDEDDDPVTADADLEVVGLALLPALQQAAAAPASSTCRSDSNRQMYYLHLPSQQQLEQQQQLPGHVLQLLSGLLQDAGKRLCVCSNAKVVLCCLSGLGLQLPPCQVSTLLDPEVLAWMADPQLVQDSSRPTDCYSLENTLARCSLPGAARWAELAPLARMQQQLAGCISVADLLLKKLRGCVGDKAVMVEMQVAVILAKVECIGVGIDPCHLLGHKAALKQRMAAISTQAQQLAGSPFNLASSSQLAKVLYGDLGLPAPTGTGARGTAKTHLPTDEASLRQLQLATGHELPGLVLEYRSKQNAVSKYFDADWVQRAARQGAAKAAAAGGGPVVVDLHCCWNQTNTATGRLSSCAPNLQAVTKYSITAEQQQQQPDAASFSIRDVFVARPGYVLLSADYSQVELRLLAHFSGDRLLQQLLSQSGPDGDVFSLIAAAWLQQGRTRPPGAPAQVDPALRERAKRVTYGIIYGVSAYGLANQLQEQGIDQDKAQRLIDSFLNRFPGVQQYMAACQSSAQSVGAVRTLLQRVRPIPGLNSPQFQDRQAAQRKVVNSIIQGSAADLAKLAMCAWDAWAESPAATAAAAAPALAGQGHSSTASTRGSSSSAAGPCARLIGQIHDELLFEVEAPDASQGPAGGLQQPGQTLLHVAGVVRRVMEGATPQLDVPLPVKLSWGSRWGSMATLEAL